MAVSLTEPGALPIHLDWLASKPQWFSCLCILWTGVAGACRHSWLSQGSWGLNSDAHASLVSTLPTDLSPLLLYACFTSVWNHPHCSMYHLRRTNAHHPISNTNGLKNVQTGPTSFRVSMANALLSSKTKNQIVCDPAWHL